MKRIVALLSLLLVSLSLFAALPEGIRLDMTESEIKSSSEWKKVKSSNKELDAYVTNRGKGEKITLEFLPNGQLALINHEMKYDRDIIRNLMRSFNKEYGISFSQCLVVTKVEDIEAEGKRIKASPFELTKESKANWYNKEAFSKFAQGCENDEFWETNDFVVRLQSDGRTIRASYLTNHIGEYRASIE